jgi:FixJ family two-component response regulator
MQNALEGEEKKRKLAAFVNRRVSIVDDNQSVRDAVRSLLRSVGLSVDVFASAEEFLNSEQLNETACMILDVRMPGMNGTALQQQLAAHNYRIPIIFITAYDDDEEMRVRVMQLGAVDLLRKPFSDRALLDAIHKGLQSGGGYALSPS